MNSNKLEVFKLDFTALETYFKGIDTFLIPERSF